MSKLDILKDKGLFSMPLKLISGVEEAFRDITESVVWGYAKEEEVLTLDNIKKWFYQLSPKQKEQLAFGVVIRLNSVSEETTRVFQGIYNRRNKVITARQINAKKLSEELQDAFGCEDMIIFAEKPNKLEF